MTILHQGILGVLLLATLASCSQESQHDAAQTTAASTTGRGISAPDALLAYEHRLRVELPAKEMPERMKALREACAQARFGVCHILNIMESEESASLTMRVQPEGVEHLIALSGTGGKIAFRETLAEDLAEAVIDNRQKQARLGAYAERLDVLSKRPQITVADLITLAREQSDVQQQQEGLQKESAQHKLRIDTHLLAVNFVDTQIHSSWRRFKLFPDRLIDHFSEGVTDALSLLIYALPFLCLAFPFLLFWRYAWRRVTGGRAKKSAS
jgi:hypothetical protein